MEDDSLKRCSDLMGELLEPYEDKFSKADFLLTFLSAGCALGHSVGMNRQKLASLFLSVMDCFDKLREEKVI